jgi:hypothetical protein
MNLKDLQKQASHEEICDGALKHYEEVSKEVCSWCSTIPRAIEFYKKFGNKDQAIAKAVEKVVGEIFDEVDKFNCSSEEGFSFEKGCRFMRKKVCVYILSKLSEMGIELDNK